MQLDPIVRDYKAYMDELADALEADDTYLYLDTSLLMWLSRIAAGARDEFIAWCRARPPETVRVPVWVAHEFHRHIQARTEAQNVNTMVVNGLAGRTALSTVAMERADDAHCFASGFTSREVYLHEFETTSKRLGELAEFVKFSDTDFERSTELVVAFANERLLESNLDPILRKLSLVGDFRGTHRVPPGFKDNKPENGSGDVVIWEEIVRDLAAAGPGVGPRPRRAVFVSRDEKHDWISKALSVRNGTTKRQATVITLGLDVRLPHPLLVHELARRAPASRMYIVSPSFLATNLAYAANRDGRAIPTARLIEVTYPRDRLQQLFWIRVGEPDGAPRAAKPVVQRSASPPSPRAPEPVSAALPLGLRSVVGHPPQDEMSDVLGAPLDEQPAVVANWAAGLTAGTMSPISLGRLLAEVTIREIPGVSSNVVGLVVDLADVLEEVALNEVALALAAAAYFDPYGKLRPRPDRTLARTALLLEQDPRFRRAFVTLHDLIVEAGAKLPYVPGAAQGSLSYELSHSKAAKGSPVRIQDIRLGGYTALVDAPLESSRTLSALLSQGSSTTCTGLELRTLLAREYLVPVEELANKYDKHTFEWLPKAALAALDPESEGGLAPFADEENDDD